MGGATFLAPTIEVAATSPRLDMLKARLRALGFSPYEANDEPGPFEPLLVDLESATSPQMKSVRRQTMQGATRPFILIGSNLPGRLDGAIKLESDADLDLLPARLSCYYRKRDTEEEAKLREQTAEFLTGAPLAPMRSAPPRLLVIGSGSIRFLALQTVLKENDIDVVAAFTVPTAREYLTRHDFTAVLVDADNGDESKTDYTDLLCGPDAGPTRPIFLVRNPDEDRSLRKSPLYLSATEILEAGQSLDALAEELTWLTFQHGTSAPLTPDQCPDSKVADRLTGCFTRTFIEHHLDQQIRQTRPRLQPLTYMTLTVSSKRDNDTAARRHLPMIAKALAGHLRHTDCAARLDWTTLGFSLRSTAYMGAARLSERCSLALAELGLPEDIAWSWRICEKRQTHSASSLIKAAMSTPPLRTTQAA